jgi:hypothetical protein
MDNAFCKDNILYPETNASNSHLISLRTIVILSSLLHLRLRLTRGLFFSDFLTRILYAFFFCPARNTCHAHLILFYLIILSSVKNKNCEAPPYKMFCNLLSLLSNLFSSTVDLPWQIKCRTHTKLSDNFIRVWTTSSIVFMQSICSDKL